MVLRLPLLLDLVLVQQRRRVVVVGLGVLLRPLLRRLVQDLVALIAVEVEMVSGLRV